MFKFYPNSCLCSFNVCILTSFPCCFSGYTYAKGLAILFPMPEQEFIVTDLHELGLDVTVEMAVPIL